ncbi:MAG: glutathione-disulfide reductase [Pseudomonadota bacterium]
MTDEYDYFVIGGGSGGVRAARIAAGHGAKVAIAESNAFGGTCVNVGCVPKKLYVYASNFYDVSKTGKSYGWDIETKSFNWQTLLKNTQEETNRISSIYQSMLEKAGVKTFKGYATLKDKHTVLINDQKITAKRILIAVGGAPTHPDFEGAEYISTSDDMFVLETLPQKMVILGAGYIGVEFACIMQKLGVEVSLIYRGDQVLRGFDHDLREFITTHMSDLGIDVKLNTNIQKVEKIENILKVSTDNDEIIETDLVLAAIGRTPNTKNIGLQDLGIKTDQKGKVIVNENFESSIPNIYAVGDITEGEELTPTALAQGHILADRLFRKNGEHSANLDLVPKAVFSSPPIATVGMTEEEAKNAGHEISIFKSNFRSLFHVLTDKNERCFMKIIVDTDTDKVLGMHMAGKDSPEIMQGFAASLHTGITKSQLDQVIGIHPTSAEEFVTMREPAS